MSSSKCWKRVSHLHRFEAMLFRDELEKAKKENYNEKQRKYREKQREKRG
jgi:hypothetical protein